MSLSPSSYPNNKYLAWPHYNNHQPRFFQVWSNFKRNFKTKFYSDLNKNKIQSDF